MSSPIAQPGGSSRTENGGSTGFRAITLRAAWRLAGALFILGTLSALPGGFLLDDFEPWMWALAAIGLLSGAACLLVPWQRLDERWLIAVPLVAAIEIAVLVAVTSYVFTYLYFFVALYVAVVFPTPRLMAPLLGAIVIALVVPFLYEDAPGREELTWILAIAPGTLLIAILVGRLTAQLEASRETYRRLSTEDGLTGVGNYRSLFERLRQETARHRRRGREFAVLTLDLDNFKDVNETQGHLVGDMLLSIVGAMLDLKVRTEDTVFRQGGDEFSVIAPETDRAQAERLAVRVEDAIRQINAGPVQVSTSVGVAVFPHDGTEPNQLLEAADRDLLARKRELRGGADGRRGDAATGPGAGGANGSLPERPGTSPADLGGRGGTRRGGWIAAPVR